MTLFFYSVPQIRLAAATTPPQHANQLLMPGPSTPRPHTATPVLLIIWAATATFAALLFGGTSIFFGLRSSKPRTPTSTTITTNEVTTNSEPSVNPFANIPESAIPGRYKWIEDGRDTGIVTLFDDHSFANQQGEKRRAFRWDIHRDGLHLRWRAARTHFTNVVGPGIYLGSQRDNQHVRIEKQE